MVLTDYNPSRRGGDNGPVTSNSVDISSIGSTTTRDCASTSESRTRYGSLFAELSQGKPAKEKKQSSFASLRFGNDRGKKSKEPKMLGDMIVTPMNYLSSRQRKRIVATWKSITDRRQLGQRIYMQVFMHKPSLKMAAVKCKHLTRWILLVSQSLFSFREVPIDQLKNNAFFNRQAAIFADFLHTVVSFVQLNSENLLKDLCHRVGVRHAMFTSVDFEPDWWRLFVSASLDCLQPYFPPGQQSRRLSSSNMVAQLPFVGQWLRDSYKQAWETLLEHAVHLMREAFTGYRTQTKEDDSGKTNFEQASNQCVGRSETSRDRRLELYNYGRAFDVGGHSQDGDDEEVELQLVIVTTPIDDYEGHDDHDDEEQLENVGCLSDGEESEQWADAQFGRDDSYTSLRETTAAPSDTCMATSHSMHQPVPPRSWQTTRKHVLRLSSLEDWDLPD